MDLLFPFDRPASGNNLLGRKEDIEHIVDCIINKRRGVILMDVPKSGKDTVVKAAFRTLKDRGYRYFPCEINCTGVNTYEEFCELFKSCMLEAFEIVNQKSLLPFTIDASNLSNDKIFDLPADIARESGEVVIVYFKEFQNVASLSDSQFNPQTMEKIWLRQQNVRYIFSGSAVNAMKSLFEKRQLFYYLSEKTELSTIPKKQIMDYITSTFLSIGRVIEKSELEEIWTVTGGSIWYIKLMCTIIHSLPAAYVNRNAVIQAKDALLRIFESQFCHIMLDLTPNQINFLRAVCESGRKFSSGEILEKYHLNSSANVFRLKDAFRKKELVIFDRQDNARITDPLFEYWLKNRYF